MTYELDGNILLFPINRTDIVDISINDIISVKGFPGLQYAWTEHDSDFVENNPDDEIFLQVEREGNRFKGVSILLR